MSNWSEAEPRSCGLVEDEGTQSLIQSNEKGRPRNRGRPSWVSDRLVA